MVGLHRSSPRAPAKQGLATTTHAHAHRAGRHRRRRAPGPAPAGHARLQEQYVGSTVAAQVIGSSGSDQSHVLTIDKGSRDGLAPRHGRHHPGWHRRQTARCLPQHRSGTRDQRPDLRRRRHPRQYAHPRHPERHPRRTGTDRQSHRRLPHQARRTGAHLRRRPGLPARLPVGTIVSIAPDPDHQPYTAIVVRPAVDLDRVEEVLVITGTQSDLPPDAQQDLTAAEAQHAADLSAERLPGIHDDETPGAPATAPTEPRSRQLPRRLRARPPIPHPLPALHPDRYTSGSTPPASDLDPRRPYHAAGRRARKRPATPNLSRTNRNDAPVACADPQKILRPQLPSAYHLHHDHSLPRAYGHTQLHVAPRG